MCYSDLFLDMKPQTYFFNVLFLGLLVASLGLAGTGVYSLLKTNSFANVKACDEEPYTEAIVLWNETFGGYYTESAPLHMWDLLSHLRYYSL